MVLSADNQAFTLSTDGLLTMLDTATQEFLWKKQLPMGKTEPYRLRHMGRNLLAYSDERASLFNAQGQVLFEQPLEGDGQSVVEIFKADDAMFSCFVRGSQVILY